MQTLDPLYTRALVSLAQHYVPEDPLVQPDVAAEKQSKLCGSIVNMGLVFRDGKVAAHAITAEADALGRASVALVQKAIDGATIDELWAAIYAAREAVLYDRAVALPGPHWEELELLRVIHPYTNRHPSTLLVFEVLEECLKQYEAMNG